MKYVIIGAGPIGAGLGGLLGLAGEEVWLIDSDIDHINAIHRDGLKLTVCNGTGPDRTERIRLHAVTSADTVGVADVIILSTKSCFTRGAVESVRKTADENTVIISNQNGLGNTDILKEFFSPDQIAYTVVGYGGSRQSLGEIRIIASKGIVNLPVTSENPGLEKKLCIMSRALAEQGFNMTYYPQPELNRLQWQKLTANCVLNGACALTHATIDGFFSCQEGVELGQKIVMENCAVANALGIPLKPEDIGMVETAVRPRIKESQRHFPSMVSDLDNCKPTENPFLNGAVVRLGKRLGIPTPCNEVVSLLITIAEQNYDCRKYRE